MRAILARVLLLSRSRRSRRALCVWLGGYLESGDLTRDCANRSHLQQISESGEEGDELGDPDGGEGCGQEQVQLA